MQHLPQLTEADVANKLVLKDSTHVYVRNNLLCFADLWLLRAAFENENLLQVNFRRTISSILEVQAITVAISAHLRQETLSEQNVEYRKIAIDAGLLNIR
ncbi:hypothetical protein AVEN_171780-1 [Araneus ventricosus]|uniref:Uncharacterized protein n=1 Tax=Araneus ventricosus TaxID=182803 RepID=A0A4Y2R580_ARAVE|nr:hypothetical protein AVEN_171780-1 [Araneus ventricosus]